MAEMTVRIGPPSEMSVSIEGGISPGDINGITPTGEALITAASPAAARTTIGATAVGSSLITAASAAAARTAIGATTVGSAVMVAANTAAAQTAIGLSATQLMTGARPAIADSTATDVAGLVTDFNALLAALSARGVIA